MKPVIATDKQHRDEMHKGYVLQIGKKLGNLSW